jgi:pilus assembly protein Flp/PilA
MKQTAWKQIRNFLKDEEGATAVEYGVLVALIIAVCIGAIYGIGTKVGESFTNVKDKIDNPSGAPAAGG